MDLLYQAFSKVAWLAVIYCKFTILPGLWGEDSFHYPAVKKNSLTEVTVDSSSQMLVSAWIT